VCSEPSIPWGGTQARGRGKTTGNGLPISLIYEGLPTVEGEKKKALDCSIKTLHKELL
jgi:hypothetical protein